MAYNQMKIDTGCGEIIHSNSVYGTDGTIESIRLSDIQNAFDKRLDLNKNTRKNFIFHASINPHPQDIVSDLDMGYIADYYMDQMGYGNQPYVVYKHTDIDRTHIHIIAPRIDENGNKIDHNNEGKRSKPIMRDLENKYNLIPYQPGQVYAIDGKPRIINYANGNLRQQLTSVVRYIVDRYDFPSLREMNSLLKLFNIAGEDIKGEVDGRQYRGLLYHALDQDGIRVGQAVKSSRIGKDVGLKALEKKFNKTEKLFKGEIIKQNKDYTSITPRIDQAMDSAKSFYEFENLLRQSQIWPIFKINEDGRITGAVFLDQENRVVFNGSRIGKKYSANVFHEKFGLQNKDSNEPIQHVIRSNENTNNELTQYLEPADETLEDILMPQTDDVQTRVEYEFDDIPISWLESVLWDVWDINYEQQQTKPYYISKSANPRLSRAPEPQFEVYKKKRRKRKPKF
ncbi:MAG: relaxase/mobilization nuclease domain-containing protein [Alistipes sp.]|nr:relaxase/mobilization nuclease domain-containing protein [Alistipes sp.]